MALFQKPPKPIPTPGGVVLTPPKKPVTGYASTAAQMPGGGNDSGAASAAGGGGIKGYTPPGSSATAGYQPAKNPWELAMKQNYEAAKANPYGSQWQTGVSQAMALGGRDYEGALRGFAQEDVNKQITSADNQLGALGMRELALREDVQADRGKMRTDASTRAMIDSQGIKANALETMRGMLGSATGANLDRIGQMIQAASTGASNYNQFSAMAIPLQERLAEATEAKKSQQTASNAQMYEKWRREQDLRNASNAQASAAMKANPGTRYGW